MNLSLKKIPKLEKGKALVCDVNSVELTPKQKEMIGDLTSKLTIEFNNVIRKHFGLKDGGLNG